MVLAPAPGGGLYGTARAGGREVLIAVHDGRLLSAPSGPLEPHASLLAQRMGHGDTSRLASDVDELLRRGRGIDPSNTATRDGHTVEAMSEIVREIEQVGWHQLRHAAADLHEVHVAVSDARGREHVIKVALPTGYPLQAEARATCDLPEPLEANAARLPGLVAAFARSLERFQEAWDVLDDWDAHTWVLDPQKPSRAQLQRRVALGKHSSLQVRVAPGAAARGVCECQLLGAEALVAPLRAKLNKGLRSWRAEESPRVNLERILECQFPERPADGRAEAELETCGVCYCYRLPVEAAQAGPQAPGAAGPLAESASLPDVVCERCRKAFHPSCIGEWLRALPTTRYTYDTVFGACPYCAEQISVRRAAQ